MINLPANLYSLPLNLPVMRRVFGESEAGGVGGSVQPGDCFVRCRSCHHARAQFWCDLKKGFIIVHLFFSGAGLSDFVPFPPSSHQALLSDYPTLLGLVGCITLSVSKILQVCTTSGNQFPDRNPTTSSYYLEAGQRISTLDLNKWNPRIINNWDHLIILTCDLNRSYRRNNWFQEAVATDRVMNWLQSICSTTDAYKSYQHCLPAPQVVSTIEFNRLAQQSISATICIVAWLIFSSNCLRFASNSLSYDVWFLRESEVGWWVQTGDLFVWFRSCVPACARFGCWGEFQIKKGIRHRLFSSVFSPCPPSSH
jgi:hypothetical protein